MNFSETVFCYPPTRREPEGETAPPHAEHHEDNAETVFVLPTEADADVRIRIFTPAAEIPFAGHPTLGSAFVLGGPLQKPVIRLETGAGIVPVELEREGARIVFGRMQQPIPTVATYPDERELLDALGV